MLKESKTHRDKTLFVKKKHSITFYVRAMISIMYSLHKHHDLCLCSFEKTYINTSTSLGITEKYTALTIATCTVVAAYRIEKTSPWGVTERKGA